MLAKALNSAIISVDGYIVDAGFRGHNTDFLGSPAHDLALTPTDSLT
jgi:hypothetical protein